MDSLREKNESLEIYKVFSGMIGENNEFKDTSWRCFVLTSVKFLEEAVEDCDDLLTVSEKSEIYEFILDFRKLSSLKSEANSYVGKKASSIRNSLKFFDLKSKYSGSPILKELFALSNSEHLDLDKDLIYKGIQAAIGRCDPECALDAAEYKQNLKNLFKLFFNKEISWKDFWVELSGLADYFCDDELASHANKLSKVVEDNSLKRRKSCDFKDRKAFKNKKEKKAFKLKRSFYCFNYVLEDFEKFVVNSKSTVGKIFSEFIDDQYGDWRDGLSGLFFEDRDLSLKQGL